LETQRKLGHAVIAVPHNGNASNGLMFDVKDTSGTDHKGLDEEWR
jgi:Protein of unknown function (DUF3604)